MSDLGSEDDLSPQTVQVLAGWLRRQEGLRAPIQGSPSIRDLVFYQCGALPPGEVAALEERLVASRSALPLVRSVRRELLRLESMPWQAVAEAAQGDDQTAEVAAVWLSLTSEQIQAMERAPAHWLADGWETVRNQMEAGVGEALATWNTFLAFGAQWGRELLAPGRSAFARGITPSHQTILPGVTDPIRVEADIDSEDALHVILRIETTATARETTPSRASAPTDVANTPPERRVLLALRRNPELWPIATAPLHAGVAEWRIQGFGAATGMPAGEIPLTALQFAFADRAPSPPAFPVRLLAEFTDRAGNSSEQPPVPIIFLEEPRWTGGEFLVRVELPPETYYWLTAGYLLRLDVAVSGSRWQHLGAWTHVDGDDAHRTLQASCPGSLDIILPSVTLIRAQLRPPE